MKRSPSLARLEAAFPGKGAELRALLKGDVKTRSYDSVKHLIESCYNPPDYAYRLMTALNEITEGCGIEVITDKGDRVVAEYVVHGDTYVTTLVRKLDTGTVMLTSYGDFVEANRL